MPRRRRSSHRPLLVLLIAVAVLALVLAALLSRRQEGEPPPAEETAGTVAGRLREPPGRTPAGPEGSGPGPGEPLPGPEIGGPPPPGTGARIALIIDDLGRSLEDLELLGRLDVPLTYSVLPFEIRSPEVVAALAGRRGEILCHLPMEPGNGANPGPGALRAAMTPAELTAATRRALDAVPGAVGVNNHMGSELSADAGAMTAVLRVLAERGMFFVDSRTSPETVAYATARRLGVAAAQRQVFLDGDRDPEVIRAQFRRLLERARELGAAIAIGHPYPETFATLAEEVPRAQAAGYEFVPVSYLLDDPGPGPL